MLYALIEEWFDENLKLLEGKNIRFITGLDGNQIKYFKEFIDFALIDEVKKLDIKKQAEKIVEKLFQDNFMSVQRDLFYKQIQLTNTQKKKIEKTTQKLNLDQRRYFLAFNPELAYLTHKHRKQRVCAFKEWVKEYNME